jgi:hypothetical protein
MYKNGRIRICFDYGTNRLIVQKKSENEGLKKILVKESC